MVSGLQKGGHFPSTVRKIAKDASREPWEHSISLAAETADVGEDAISPVTKDYDTWDNKFTGTNQYSEVSLKCRDFGCGDFR